MNYEQMQAALQNGKNLIAVFDGTVYYENGDEYPIISYPPYEIIKTGGMNFWYFEKDSGLPPGIREVCYADDSPYSKIKIGFERSEVYEFHALGVLPDFLLDGLVGDGFSYQWKGEPIRGFDKLEIITSDEGIDRYELVREGLIEIASGMMNPNKLHPFRLKYPYLWYWTCQHSVEKIFVHHTNSSYQPLLEEVLSLLV